MRTLLLSLIFVFYSSAAFAADVYMSTTGTRASGKSTAGDWSNANCYGNLHNSFAAMSAGDTLTIDDGTYAGSGNTISQFYYPPSGSAGALTVVKARNVPGQGGLDAGQRLRVIFSATAAFNASNYPSNSSEAYVQYVKFEGIRWNGGISAYINFDHLYFKQCAAQGETDGDTATVSVNGQNNLFEDVVAFGKGRYRFLFYDPSREAQTRGDGNNLCRRCIARIDWANKNNVLQNPIAGFSSYFNRGTALLNSMVIDSDLPSYWMDDPGELPSAIYQPNDSGPHKLTVKGSIVMNTALSAAYVRNGSSGHVMEDVLAIKTAGGFGLVGDTTANRLTILDEGTDNFTYRSATQKSRLLAKDVGITNSNSGVSTVTNSVISGVTGYAVQGVGLTTDYLNIYGATAGNFDGAATSANLITTNPVYGVTANPLGSLHYPVKAEPGSLLATAGSAGGPIGAQVMYRLGIDGTFKGDTNWDTPQGDLWPWPLQDWVQAEMRSMDTVIASDGAGQVAPYNVPHNDTMPDPNRGFCAPGQTLTNYIWGALSEYYTPPTTTPSKAPGRYTATQQLSLTASAGVAKYCFGAGCTPTATYSSPIKILQNLARQTVRVQSVDGSNVEPVQELVFLKQRRR